MGGYGSFISHKGLLWEMKLPLGGGGVGDGFTGARAKRAVSKVLTGLSTQGSSALPGPNRQPPTSTRPTPATPDARSPLARSGAPSSEPSVERCQTASLRSSGYSRRFSWGLGRPTCGPAQEHERGARRNMGTRGGLEADAAAIPCRMELGSRRCAHQASTWVKVS